MLATVANTASTSLLNNLRKTEKSSKELLANPRLVRPVSPSTLIGGKGKIGGQTRANCVQDYSPCDCVVYSDNQISVECDHVSVETVRDVFQRVKDPEIYKLQLYAIPDEITKPVSLPADILGNTGVTAEIDIGCYSDYLVIDPLAFRSSQNSLAQFSVRFFDFGLQNNFSFLKGFNRLESLNFSSMNNLTAFQYLPPLPSLQYLSIEGCPDINQIAFPDLSPAKLKKLYLNHNELSEQKADEILTKLAASTSTDSLQQLFLTGNSWTRIPSQVGSTFPKLRGVYLGYNKISHIPIVFSQFCVPF